MASSQVEVATSSPFGCVLRDHNSRRDRRKDTNGTSNSSPKSQSHSFQRNFKDLVRDHLQSCISLSPRASSNHETDENSNHQCGGGFSCFGGGPNGASSKSTTVTTTCNQKNGDGVGQKGKEVSIPQPQAQALAQAKAQARSQNQTSFVTGSGKKERRDPSPAKSESSNSDFSVSSLVQRWRGFEANHGACCPTTTTTSACASMEAGISRANSVVSTSESILTVADESGEREEMSSVEEKKQTTTTTREEKMKEKERERRERERERERERIRVADIVRKWPGDESRVCLARLKIRRDNKGKCECEGKIFSPNLVSSPRIRGRQAIADTFMRMERERYDEVGDIGSNYPVTNFAHRGRIQALFRLRLLRRDQTIEEQRRPPLPPRKGVGSSRCRAGTSITSLKKTFSSSADQDSVHHRTTSKETPNPSPHGKQIASTSKHISEQDSSQHEPNVQKFLAKREQETENASTLSKQSIDDQSIQISDKKSVSTTSNDSSNQITTKEESTIPTHSDDCVNTVASDKNSESQLDSHCEEEEEEEARQNTVLEAPQDDVHPSEAQDNDYEEDEDVNMEEEPEASYNGYWGQGETEDYYYKDAEASQSYFEPNLDWISDIARPRSYWEDLRQAWYREVFNTRSQNEEIRQLLERGNVSNVLASDFRERMDHLLTNSVQRAAHFSLEENVEDVEDARQENRMQLLERGCVSAVLAGDFGERMDQLFMNRMQRATPSSVVEEQNEDTPSTPEQIKDDGQEDSDEEEGQEDSDEEEGQEEDNDEEEGEQENGEIEDEGEDDSSSYRHQYQNVNDFYEQNSTSSRLHWNEDDDDESNYYSDNAESTSTHEPSPLTSYDRATHEGSSSFKNPSIEMELIYDLRSHMEQLYREMAELRKSVTSCMDMQIKMQHTIREEVSAAIMRQGSDSKVTKQVERKDSNRRKSKKGTCCICCEKKVDSLLYKCGHMCTCFDCANELQWGSGKCPICRAQIIDVVRAFPDS